MKRGILFLTPKTFIGIWLLCKKAWFSLYISLKETNKLFFVIIYVEEYKFLYTIPLSV
jgi:hypothetical protein